MARAADLLIRVQDREAAEHAAENERSRRRQQYLGGVARVVADDLPAGRVRRVLGVSEGGDGRAVKDR